VESPGVIDSSNSRMKMMVLDLHEARAGKMSDVIGEAKV